MARWLHQRDNVPPLVFVTADLHRSTERFILGVEQALGRLLEAGIVVAWQYPPTQLKRSQLIVALGDASRVWVNFVVVPENACDVPSPCYLFGPGKRQLQPAIESVTRHIRLLGV